MRSAHLSRWAISFADLTLLLLGLFVMLYVNAQRQAGGVPDRTGLAPARPAILNAPASELFEPREARLSERARARLHKVGREAAAHGGSLRVETAGSPESGRRFDRWELGAARAAAVARALEEGGLPQRRIDIALPPVGGTPVQPQRIIVRGG